MALGPMVRGWMPPKIERRLAGIYRSVFVDLRKLAAVLASELVPDAMLLDVGGGDGELLNHLLAARPDVRVTMVDVAPSVGRFIEPRYREQVELHPSTSLEQHLVSLAPSYDAVLVSDVMHHLPAHYRKSFLQAAASTLAPGGSIFVKDLEPGHVVSWLSLLCDKYISGDRGVVLISAEELGAVASRALPPHRLSEAGLMSADRPNYLLRIELSTA